MANFDRTVPTQNRIEILWQEREDWIKLEADLAVPSASITGTGPAGEIQHIAIPDTSGLND